MRAISTIVSAISLLLLILVLFLWLRSHSRYEGILHYGSGAPLKVKASYGGKVVEDECPTRSSGWISFPGQLTYVSVANPVNTNDWESWSEPLDTSLAAWSPLLAADAVIQSGLRWGSAETVRDLRDLQTGYSWKLSYSYFTIPYWMLSVLLVILPYRWVADYRWRQRRIKQGLCVNCGHIVRGVVGDCPKCGKPLPEKGE